MSNWFRLCAGAVLFASSFLASVLDNPIQIKPAKGRAASGALEALRFWTQSRAFPDVDISPDKHYKAFESMKTQVPAVGKAGGPSWRFIGPLNFSGRMISVAFHPHNPDTLYAGSASGGLWRSNSGGLNPDWHRVTTGYPVLGVNAIAISPADPRTIYIGTGEVYSYTASIGGTLVRTTRGSYGMGLLKTTDGGATWTKSIDWSYNQQRGIQAIKLNPLNPNTVLAATSEGMYKSTNAGATWYPVLNVLMARDIAINTHDTNKVLVTCGNFASPGAGVYRSTDGGEHFVQVGGLPSFSGMAMLGMYPANPDRVFLLLSDSTTVVGTLWRSTDFGAGWTLVNTDNTGDVQGWYSRFLAVHPTDSNQIVRGAQGLRKSTNGGASFFSPSSVGWADYHSYAYHPTNPDILYIVDDGGVWRSTDFGTSFTFAGEGLQTAQFYNGFSSSAQDSLRALGQVQDHFGWMYTWHNSWASGGVDEVGWTAIDQSNDNFMYAGTRGGGSIYKSSNRGFNYSPANSGLTGGSSAWNAPFVLSPSHPSVLYFGRNLVFKSTNSAASWLVTNGGSVLDGSPMLSMAISHTHPDTVYAGTAPGARIFRTTNGGAAWQNMTSPQLPQRYPLDIAVDPRNPSIVYVAFGGFNADHLFKSTDAGLTWNNITGILPDVPATAVIVDPFNSNHVYAGTDIGVFLSTDGGTGWIGFNEGLPEAVIVSDLSISPSNRSIRTVTHSNGVYERPLYSTVTSVRDEKAGHPATFTLGQNYPNPFNPTTRIDFRVSSSGPVSLKVYDVGGREVATLVSEVKGPGSYRVHWDAGQYAGGVYYYRMASNTKSATRKMLLLK